MKQNVICDDCGKTFDKKDGWLIHGEWVCDECTKARAEYRARELERRNHTWQE